jgi:hypothetical protein
MSGGSVSARHPSPSQLGRKLETITQKYWSCTPRRGSAPRRFPADMRTSSIVDDGGVHLHAHVAATARPTQDAVDVENLAGTDPKTEVMLTFENGWVRTESGFLTRPGGDNSAARIGTAIMESSRCVSTEPRGFRGSEMRGPQGCEARGGVGLVAGCGRRMREVRCTEPRGAVHRSAR